MAAVRPKSKMTRTKSNENSLPRQERAAMNSSDQEVDSDCDLSETIEEKDGACADVESEEEGDVADSDDIDEIGEEEYVSDDECLDGEDESDTSDDDMDDDDGIEGDDWMDVEEKSDHDSTSSDEEETAAESSSTSKLHGNEGWADAMAKILRSTKPKRKKSIVLAKAKKLNEISISENGKDVKKDDGFEIASLEIKDTSAAEEDEKPNVEELDKKPKIEELDIKPEIKQEKLAETKVKPSILDREREKALSKIATKGVVQLFNAVRERQKTLHGKLKEAKGSIVKQDRVFKSIDKKSFLDVLMGSAPSEKIDRFMTPKTEGTTVKAVPEEETWSVLRDNFLTGSDFKNWDKNTEMNTEDNGEIELI